MVRETKDTQSIIAVHIDKLVLLFTGLMWPSWSDCFHSFCMSLFTTLYDAIITSSHA